MNLCKRLLHLHSVGLTLSLLLLLHGALAYATTPPSVAQEQLPTPIPQTVVAPENDTPLLPDKPMLRSGALVTTPVIFAPPDRQLAAVAAPQSANAAPLLTIWYGPEQTFGQWGNPQQWVNVLGNVVGSNRITLTYSLNGGASQALTLGPNKRRLPEAGDFNIELDVDELRNGPNQVVVTAIDRKNLSATTVVTVNYTTGTAWPLPYTADWATAPTIQSVAQIVDGRWAKAGATIRPLVFEYDRLIAIGDRTWSSYEVVVPVTVHALNEEGFAFPSSGPGVGILLRWTGHYQETTEQPRNGWRNLGALGWFRWGKDSNDNIIAGLQMIGYNNGEIATNPQILPAFNVPYLMRMQVEAVANGGDSYRFKVWPSADPEPAAWQMSGQGLAGEPVTGSFLLVAHESDVSFGKVDVCPLQAGGNNAFRPALQITGAGAVTLSPDRASYHCGEEVTLTATPAPGWRFAAWSGAAAGEQNPYPLSVRGAGTVGATFVQERVMLDVTVAGSGDVNVAPLLPDYTVGDVVTLTAIPAPEWRFAGWEGDLAGSTNPVQLTMDRSKRITAAFTTMIPTQTYTLTTAVVGEGAVVRTPDQTQYLAGSMVTLTAAPAPGWQFAGWQGLTATNNPATVVMTANRHVTATFVPLRYTLATTIVGEGEIQRAPALVDYPHGSVVTLTAAPAPGWQFAGWQGLTATNNPATVVMTANQLVTATFVPLRYAVATTIVGQGTIQRTPDLVDYPHGSVVTLRAQPAPSWIFAGWRGDATGTASPLALTVDRARQLTATFVEMQPMSYALLASAGEGGSVAHVPVLATYPAGTVVTLTATPNSGWRFDRWQGDLQSAVNPLLLTMNRAYTVQAHFTRTLVSFTTAVEGGGFIDASLPPGNYPYGTAVTLTANPAPDTIFLGWAGALQGDQPTATLVLEGDKAVIARFGPAQHTLTLAVTGAGTISADQSAPYVHNQTVQLTAIPQPGSRFTGWSGDLAGQSNPTAVVMDRDKTVTANFEADISGTTSHRIYIPLVNR